MWLVMEVKSDDVKSNIALEPVMLGPWIKANWKWSNGDSKKKKKKKYQHFRKLKWNAMGEFNLDDHYVYYWTSLVAQKVKHLPTTWETWVWSLGGEDPLEKDMATRSGTLAWRIPWMEKPGGL